MIAEFKLPDLGEGLTESEIVSWAVAVGDSVTLNQVLGEVETAKAVVELPSPYAGTVTAITHDPGTTVNVGEVIIAFEVADVAGTPTKTPTETTKRTPTLVGYGAEPELVGAPVRRARTFVQTSPVSVATAADTQAPRPRSTPPVRKLARDLGIDLESLVGSGERGLITRQDVVTFSGGHATVTETKKEAPASDMERQVRTPIRGMQKAMAQAMVHSAFTAPHVTEFLTVDVTTGMEFLARLRQQKAFEGVKVTPLTLAAKAVALAVVRQPTLNSRWDEAAQEVVMFNYLNLGIAAATPRGLLVPNIKDVQTLGLRQLAIALGELATTAREGKTTPADLVGGTFSITNIGVFGIDAGTPIINPGEAGILALGAVRKMPWEHQGQVALRDVMTLSLSFDHRLVDGAQGSRFLADVAAVVADPAMALAMDQ